MTEIHGITGAPYQTPNVRRKLPAPFTRPLIDLDGATRVKRTWKDVSVLEVKKGDTVAEIGVIDAVNEFIQIPGSDEMAALTAESERPTVFWRVRLINVMGEYWDFPGHQRVYAFTPDVDTP